MMAFKAVDEFLKCKNWQTQANNSDAKYWNIAVKFLMARKFDVKRALELYDEHEALRKTEGLDSIDLNDQLFIKNLESGKFTILPFIKNYPVYALFTVKYHTHSTNHLEELSTLKSLIYQLDAALENPDAQRNGLVFIYDMNDCKRTNYDLSLSQKILTLMRGSYPARLNKLLVVSAPFWFKCVVKVLSILMREKLRERVQFVNIDELTKQIPHDVLPESLGGKCKIDHKSWLLECNKLITNKSSTCSSYYYHSSSSTSTSSTSSLTTHNSSISSTSAVLAKSTKQDNKLDELCNKIQPLPFQNFYESIHNNEDGFTIDELLDHLIKTGSNGLSEEFKQIRLQPVLGSYDVFKDRDNMYKNRYRDVICLDESRVKLFDTDNGDDYIHANYADGYKQKNAYISTQGPLDETVKDFWQMVWQEKILVIAMTTKVMEQKRLKCAQYWPLEKNETMNIENLFEITTCDVNDDLVDYRVSKLVIKNLRTQEKRNLVHCQFLSWPDHGVPTQSKQILEFIDLVRKHQVEKMNELNPKWTGHPQGPPICVHCSAGIGRTGTFLTIDICVNRLKDSKRVNIEDIVNKIRLQRAQSVQMRDQYVFCYMAVIEYAKKENLLKNNSDSQIDLETLFDGLF